MAATYDLILTGGTVVNHDGDGRRDVGVSGGRIAAIGDLVAGFRRRDVSTAAACISCRA